MIIDAYTHCGQDKFLPVEAVQQCMSDAGVAKAVLCQHLGQTDNSYIASCVRANPSVFAGVALIDGADPDWEAALDAVIDDGLLSGIRMTAEMMRGNPSLPRAVLDRGLNVVMYTPDGIDDAVDMALGFQPAHRGGRLIITHLGCPSFDGSGMSRSRTLLECAAGDYVMVTLSGLGMFTPFPHHAAGAFVRDVVSAFGSDRVMWGSNFPVVGDSTAYELDLGLVLRNAWGLPEAAIPDVAGLTAEATWFS